ncbi:hypothetical protein GCM10011323_28890 [Pontibacter amylolyticus]|uniref:Uncharacterized protein n=1 Tax=Pontibacter amylolyticus TaxID=1424080 RepID=A0ABQ1WC10_9BACT|nr:hypothetical protein GCM10011323_28890 [Pontibacter amylolyticus]
MAKNEKYEIRLHLDCERHLIIVQFYEKASVPSGANETPGEGLALSKRLLYLLLKLAWGNMVLPAEKWRQIQFPETNYLNTDLHDDKIIKNHLYHYR